MSRKIHLALSIVFIVGCSSPSPNEETSYDFPNISEGIRERTDYTLRQASEPDQFNIPEWVTLDDGLSQDEAVALALWNNAQFQADLAALGFARAELLEANMLSNPVFSVLFPVSPKLLETALDIPIDALWQRPHRVAAAKLDAQRLSENLIENGLGLIRDIQIAYGDLLLARERIILATEEAQLKAQITQLDQARLRAGEISELTANTSYVDTLRAADNVKLLSKKAEILEQRLYSLLGITSDDITFDVVPSEISPISPASVDEMLKIAFACRPDLRAAELAIESAGERIGWEKSKVYNFIAVLDGDDTEDDSFTIRPGFSVEFPIFNQNDAKIAYAKAELEQAAQRYEAIRQNIILQVQQGYTQYISAHEQFDLWSSDIIPSLEQAVEQTQKSYEAGDVSLISVLHVQRELIEARMHLTELVARLNSSTAELNYCIGKKMI
ncbi:MAG: TolC family protein [Phycisphaerae bacterium]|nr:TolC family protein [Phycisphaerae bacterium]